MFYTIDFSAHHYRRRARWKCVMWFVTALIAGAGVLLSYRILTIVRRPHLDETLLVCDEHARRLQDSMAAWTTCLPQFAAIKPLWSLNNPVASPTNAFACLMANRNSWQEWLAPRHMDFTVGGNATVQFDLIFPEGSVKSRVLAEVEDMLTRSMAGLSPKIVFNVETINEMATIPVTLSFTPQPFRWPDGMPAPPQELNAVRQNVRELHARIWAYRHRKGPTLLELASNAIDASARLFPVDCGNVMKARWTASQRSQLSPRSLYADIQQDLRDAQLRVDPPELTRAIKAWNEIGCRRIFRVCSIDNADLIRHAAEWKGIVGQCPPSGERFTQFGRWLDAYCSEYSNAYTRVDVHVDNEARDRMWDMLADALPDFSPKISCVERQKVSCSEIGYSEWEIKPAARQEARTHGSDPSLSELLTLCLRLGSDDRGFRINRIMIEIASVNTPSEGWVTPPTRFAIAGLLPWRATDTTSAAVANSSLRDGVQPEILTDGSNKLDQKFKDMRDFMVGMCEKDEQGQWRTMPGIRPPPSNFDVIAINTNDTGIAVPAPLERRVWDLPINGITYDDKGNCVALSGPWRLVRGTRIKMLDSPDDRCGYRILDVTPRHVWAWALLKPDEENPEKTPSMLWPDFNEIYLESREGSRRVPTGMKLSDGRLLLVGHSAVYPGSEARLKLLRVWQQGGEFSLIDSSDAEESRLICLIP